MNKELETKLRLRVRKLVESVLNEEPPMEKPDAFKPKKPVSNTARRFGNIWVDVGSTLVILEDKKANTKISFSRDDANKIAQYLYRVVGKV